MKRHTGPVVLLLALGIVSLAAPRSAPAAVPKPKKPRLDVRAVPRMALSPVTILFTAELVGGDDVEEYYCPELEWDWDDGGKSVQEGDCPPYETGSKLVRRFTSEHEYRRAGAYNVKLTLLHSKKALTSARVTVTVRPGFGDVSREES